jgi:hypothetical protein
MASTVIERRPLASVRWRRLLPVVFVTYSLAYLDRSNYSIGAAGGLERDAHHGGSIGTARSAVLPGLLPVPDPGGALR